MSHEENPANLKRRRAMIQGSCTRMKTFLDSIDAITPLILAQLEERKTKLDQLWSDYDAIQTKLELREEAESNHRTVFEETYFLISARIRELITPSSLHTPLACQTPPASNASDVTGALTHVRLPKINMPTFSGDYEDWYPFFDTFNALIHTNVSISNIQKFQYLKASLVGDANNLISALEISDLNYDVAWNLLKQRYDNKRVIVQTHIRAILDLPCMSKEGAVELRQIADGATRHIHALQALKRPTSQWDDLLVHLLSLKLDPLSSREWQSSLSGTELPTMKQFMDFLAHRCRILESSNKRTPLPSKGMNNRAQSKRHSTCAVTVKSKCAYCHGDHYVYFCKDFQALSIPRRVAEMRKRKLCLNCLRSTLHTGDKCTAGSCKLCKQRHNTLLHDSTQTTEVGSSNAAPQEVQEHVGSPAVLAMCDSNSCATDRVILSTALIHVEDGDGTPRPCRVLLDCGSQANFISKRFLNALRIKPRSSNVSVSGINQTTTRSSQMIEVKIKSRLNSFRAVIDCIVMERITNAIPAVTLKRSKFDLPRNIKLADPQFHISSEIDMLIGAELFWQLLCVGQIRASAKHPTLQKTRFGWILAGRLNQFPDPLQGVQALHVRVTNHDLQKQLSGFWQIEEVADGYTREESICDQHFIDNVSQAPQGRYIVKLPTKEHIIEKLGSSKEFALKRLYGLEKRFKRDPELKRQYSAFINEYINLGHMKLINESGQNQPHTYYLPHHCVFKASQNISNLRVVFDASCKTNTGISLNDALLVGPVIQQDLVAIMLRFRTLRYVFVADVVKMYRQILVHPTQTRLQRILWRNNDQSRVQTYELVTLTYGTASASYLATRCLKHLADQHADKYPIGSICVKQDFYVDDLLTGADSISDAKLARDEIVQLLRLGAFELGKWSSNCAELLPSKDDNNNEIITIGTPMNSSVLGVHWNQSQDTFHFSYETQEISNLASKRSILSDISKLFDPLGLLGPIILVAKLIMQELWQAGTSWDESVPQDIHLRWSNLKSQLHSINRITIPRLVKFATNPRLIQIHGFCDASQRAYGACIYIRTEDENGKYRSELLCSKSRVAPLKTITLPRLELQAAVLLSRLFNKINRSFSVDGIKTFLWSDSTIVLNWISSPSKRWAVFVANRVGEIQSLTETGNWCHISSASNPADILSRGAEPRELANLSLWWHGPAFLQSREDFWPKSKFVTMGNEIPEIRATTVIAICQQRTIVDDLLCKFSSLPKICRVLAYCLRFVRRHPSPSCGVFVTHQEVSNALNVICRTVQNLAFSQDYKALSKGKQLDSSSKLLTLSPFLDHDGLLRVGGRLKNSNLNFDACHQILLPSGHVLTKLIVRQEHVRSGHAGAQATMSAIRQRFWPLSLRSVVRRVIKSCVTCFKSKPTISEAIMAPLPAQRVTESRPFYHCGVDYAGPLLLRETKRRNAKTTRAYMAIFVCFATKAIHIELVSDLTSDAFIAVFKRFISRRGKPSRVFSDNGTTFVGAQRQLKECFDFLNNESNQDEIREFLRTQEVNWSFIPPNAPHFGGIWEAAVKSAKYHLYRIVGRANLTFEEMTTVLCEIEAILNSRPITPLSEDPNDLSYLSPGHFLIGAPLNSYPYHDITDVNENRLIRWQRVEQLKQHFWSRWSKEYLHSLQERTKWKRNKGEQLKPGQLVILNQTGLSPLHWLLGRIERVHTGSDGIARAAVVKTNKGYYTRPLCKIAILPIDKDLSNVSDL